jgi:hypothetical protein
MATAATQSKEGACLFSESDSMHGMLRGGQNRFLNELNMASEHLDYLLSFQRVRDLCKPTLMITGLEGMAGLYSEETGYIIVAPSASPGTVAHELWHAVQKSYNIWDAPSAFIEAGAYFFEADYLFVLNRMLFKAACMNRPVTPYDMVEADILNRSERPYGTIIDIFLSGCKLSPVELSVYLAQLVEIMHDGMNPKSDELVKEASRLGYDSEHSAGYFGISMALLVFAMNNFHARETANDLMTFSPTSIISSIGVARCADSNYVRVQKVLDYLTQSSK